MRRRKTGRVDAGCSPLQLLWKDAHTAQYFVNTDRDGVVLQRQEVTVRRGERAEA